MKSLFNRTTKPCDPSFNQQVTVWYLNLWGYMLNGETVYTSNNERYILAMKTGSLKSILKYLPVCVSVTALPILFQYNWLLKITYISTKELKNKTHTHTRMQERPWQQGYFEQWSLQHCQVRGYKVLSEWNLRQSPFWAFPFLRWCEDLQL